MSETSTSILDRAVLVCVNFKRFGTSRGLKDMADNIARENGAATNRVKATKRLLDCDEIDALGKHDGATRQFVYDSTIPAFAQEGFYLLPVEKLDTFEAEIGARATEREALVKAAADRLPEIISNDIAALGSLADPTDYPSASEFTSAHSLTWRYVALSVPDKLKGTKYFDTEAAKERAQESSMEQGIRTWLRQGLYDHLERMIDRLGERTKKDGTKAVCIFRNSTVTNFTKYLDAFEMNNLTGDTELAACVADARVLIEGTTADELRENEAVRAYVKGGCESIAANVAILLGAQPQPTPVTEVVSV